MEHEDGIDLLMLPESCIWTILSFTTPRDVCRLSAVCKFFRSAAYDDYVWSKFLPQYYEQLLSKAASPVAFSSNRDLYFRLSDSILIEGETKEQQQIFWLERSTAKIGYMLSARTLGIPWGNDKRYWRWVSVDNSRFDEVAELLSVCWMEARNRFDCRKLSANTEYRVLFLIKFGERPHGWNALPIKFSIKTPDGEEMETGHILAGIGLPINSDGWMEVVAGEFIVKAAYEDSSIIEFCMKEVQSNFWKRGLLIQGVKIEPKYT